MQLMVANTACVRSEQGPIKLDAADIQDQEGNSLFKTNLPSISTPLDALFAEHQARKAQIETISAYVNKNTNAVLHYFAEGARQTHNTSSVSMPLVFQAEPAIRALDADFWGRAFSLTDIYEYMPAKKRNEWNAMMRTGFREEVVQIKDKYGYVHNKTEQHPIPHFTERVVRETLRTMLDDRPKYFAERIDGIWTNLSPEHLTNNPAGFSRRVIMRRVINYYDHVDSDMANYIHDMRCVIAMFMGRDTPEFGMTSSSLSSIAHDVMKSNGSGHWYEFDGGSWAIRCYKIGTAHLRMHPDMAWRFNQVLASLHPLAIPSEFRTKPPKKKKSFQMVHDLIPFEVLRQIDCLERVRNTPENAPEYGFRFYEEKQLTARTTEVLSYIGGVKKGQYGPFAFDYNPSAALREILDTGRIPEMKSHQYYPTPSELAAEAIRIAQIRPEHSCLEPSAGQGALACLMDPAATTCVEISALHCAILQARGYKTVCADFLDWSPDNSFDRIVMNPPYAGGRVTEHVAHAARLLNPTGVLVAILPASFRNTEIVPGWNHAWTEVYKNLFRATSISVAIVKLTPPQG